MRNERTMPAWVVSIRDHLILYILYVQIWNKKRYFQTEQSGRIGPKPPPPPLTPENGHVATAKQPALPPKTSTLPEPDYEVIEFSNQQYSNAPMRPSSSSSSGNKTPGKQSWQMKMSICKCQHFLAPIVDTKLKCTLCGSNNPWVMCEECSKQIFCASCDDMFHKHPKRKTHQRKVSFKIP